MKKLSAQRPMSAQRACLFAWLSTHAKTLVSMTPLFVARGTLVSRLVRYCSNVNAAAQCKKWRKVTHDFEAYIHGCSLN